MSVFVGDWKLISAEKDEEFMRALGYDDDAIAFTKEFNDPRKNVVVKYTLTDPNSVTSIVAVGGVEKFSQTTPFGDNFTVKDPTGTESTIIHHGVEGNVMTLKQKLGDKVATYVTTVNNNDMTEIMEVGNVKATRVMLRVSDVSQ